MSGAVMDRLIADQSAAFKARDHRTVDLLASVIAECSARSKRMRPVRALTNGEVLIVVRKHVSRINRLIGGSGEDTAQMRLLERDREQLHRYLPLNELSDEEVADIAAHLHAIMSMKGILDHLKESYAGRYDPRRAADIVRGVVNT